MMKFKSVTFEDSLFKNCVFEDITSLNTYFRNCTFVNTTFYNTGNRSIKTLNIHCSSACSYLTFIISGFLIRHTIISLVEH